MIQRINPASLYDASPFGMSQASVDPSGLVYLSGQVAWDQQARVVGATYAGQTRIALANLELALEAAGSDLHRLLHIRIFIRGEVADHLAEIVPVLVERLGAIRPALTGIGVTSLATPDTLVEIEAIAQVRTGTTEGQSLVRGDTDRSIFDDIVVMFRGPTRWLTVLAGLFALALLAVSVVCGWQFATQTNLRSMQLWGVGTILSVLGLGLIKLWFWMELQKIGIVREFKRVELQLATLSAAQRSRKVP